LRAIASPKIHENALKSKFRGILAYELLKITPIFRELAISLGSTCQIPDIFFPSKRRFPLRAGEVQVRPKSVGFSCRSIRDTMAFDLVLIVCGCPASIGRGAQTKTDILLGQLLNLLRKEQSYGSI